MYNYQMNLIFQAEPVIEIVVVERLQECTIKATKANNYFYGPNDPWNGVPPEGYGYYESGNFNN